MIKTSLKFIIGFVLGSISLFVLIYIAGFTLDAAGITLFDSEDDQQRNFNIIMILWLVVAFASGGLTIKIGNKTKP